MKIAIIGAGKIGGTIGPKWERAGHEVVYGLRDPAKREGAKAIGAALEGAGAALLAISGAGVADLVREHAGRLDGLLVLDATNNVPAGAGHLNAFPVMREAVPRARLYRAFNTLGWESFAEPVVGGQQADLFFAGPDGADRRLVEGLIADVGLRPVWVGGDDATDTVDALVMIWFSLMRRLGRHVAFKLLTDDGRV